MALQARSVDPRDVNVEVDAPTFRVYFWRSAPGLACREFEVTGGDVDEVIDWAQHNKQDGEDVVLSVVTSVVGTGGDQVILTRIMGTDPGLAVGDGPSHPAVAGG